MSACLLFDCDGTLVDSERLCSIGLVRKFQELATSRNYREKIMIRLYELALIAVLAGWAGTAYASPVKAISELSVHPEKTAEFLEWVKADLEKSRTFAGNLQFDIYVDVQEKGKVVFVERWESESLQAEYSKWRAERGDFVKMREFLAAPPKMRTYIDPDESGQ
ncbi:MAG: antibiotic biosynthesis monooxygenase [Cellvibrionaceae bacterium]